MDTASDPRLKSLTRLGTFVVELPELSKTEGAPYVAQMRRLRGEHYGTYMREQNRIQAALARMVSKQTEGAEPAPMSEEDEKYLYQAVASMRTLLTHAIVRVCEVPAEGDLVQFKPTAQPVGDHAETEISLDLLERDYARLVNRLLVKSGLLPEVPEQVPFPTGQADNGNAGPDSETVRAAAEPTGEGTPA